MRGWWDGRNLHLPRSPPPLPLQANIGRDCVRRENVRADLMVTGFYPTTNKTCTPRCAVWLITESHWTGGIWLNLSRSLVSSALQQRRHSNSIRSSNTLPLRSGRPNCDIRLFIICEPRSVNRNSALNCKLRNANQDSRRTDVWYAN